MNPERQSIAGILIPKAFSESPSGAGLVKIDVSKVMIFLCDITSKSLHMHQTELYLCTSSFAASHIMKNSPKF